MRVSPTIGEYFLYGLADTQPGGRLRVVGVERPYDATTLLWKGERFLAVHIKSHRGYWSRMAHYIPAECQVLEVRGYDGGDRSRPFVDDVWTMECGHRSAAVKATAVAEAQRREAG